MIKSDTKAATPTASPEKQRLLDVANNSHALTKTKQGGLLDSELFAATGEIFELKYADAIRDTDFPSAGALTATIRTIEPGLLRVASWEETPASQAGGLVDRTYPTDGSTVVKYPVTGENKGEHDRVAFGFKPEAHPDTADETVSFPARYYEVVRTDQGELQAQFTGIQNLDATILLRNGQPTPTVTPQE